MRWCVEESFQICKGQVGLDHYQCRGWTSWHRYTILAMLAMAVLTLITAQTPTATTVLIPLTVPETRRIINAVAARPADLALMQAWSVWRRHHQARARASHYKHRHQLELTWSSHNP